MDFYGIILILIGFCCAVFLAYLNGRERGIHETQQKYELNARQTLDQCYGIDVLDHDDLKRMHDPYE